MKSFLTKHRTGLIICGIFFVVSLFRLNDLSLYTDSTRYLIWGNSLAHGKGFVDDTQPEPERYVVNAPLYSVLLAPALIVFPFSLTAAKVWTLFWGGLALLILYLWLHRSLGKKAALAGTLFLAFNPLMVVISTEALSEAPFMAALLGVFLLMEKRANDSTLRSSIPLFVIASFLMLLREASISLIAALVLFFFLRKKPVQSGIILATAGALYGLWMLRNLVWVGAPEASQSANVQFVFQHFVTSPESPFISELVHRIWLNGKGFAFELGGMMLYLFPLTLIVNPSSVFEALYNSLNVVKWVVPVVVVPLVVWGIVDDWKKSDIASLRLLFFVFSVAIILSYPIHDVRFLLPLIPLVLYYLARSFIRIQSRIGPKGFLSSDKVSFGLILLVMAPNLACLYEILRTNITYQQSPLAVHETIKRTKSTNEYFTTPWSILGAWIQEHIPSGTVIASSVKEIVPFIGDRKKLEINNGVPLPVFEAMIRDNAVEYVLAPIQWGDFKSYEFSMAESKRFWFEPIYQVADLNLFKVHSQDIEGPKRKVVEFDTTTATGLLWRGRIELLNEQYRTASSSFKRAQALVPGEPAVKFQSVVAAALAGDSADALRDLNILFLMPRSTTYTWAAQAHIQTMSWLLKARRQSNPADQSTRIFDAATFYWNVGLYRAAYRLIKESIREDSTYFVGLLWGWHFAIQVGDTVQARACLRRLEQIDAENAVVSSFRRMSQLSDTLKKTHVVRERCRLRLAIAQEYDKMQLPEEAIDETERSIHEDAKNIKAFLYLGELYEKKKKLRAARKAYQHVLEIQPDHPGARKKLEQTVI